MTRCPECGGKLERTKAGQPYQYLESGLKNVYLEGITLYHCRSCQTRFPEIPNIDRLHVLIAEALVVKPFGLTGPEFRFLRKQVRMKAKELAAFLGVSPVTISRWETGAERVGVANDRLMRSYHMFWRLQHGEIVDPSQILERLRSQFIMIKPQAKTTRIHLPVRMLEMA